MGHIRPAGRVFDIASSSLSELRRFIQIVVQIVTIFVVLCLHEIIRQAFWDYCRRTFVSTNIVWV